MRPHRRKPTRLPHPWDSPGKNTGVGCHFLLQCMKMKSESEVAQSCPTLSNPMDCSLPGSSSIHGIFQARVLEWGAVAFSILTTGQRELLQPLSYLFDSFHSYSGNDWYIVNNFSYSKDWILIQIGTGAFCVLPGFCFYDFWWSPEPCWATPCILTQSRNRRYTPHAHTISRYSSGILMNKWKGSLLLGRC